MNVRGLSGKIRPADPGGYALRAALRVAVVAPAVFAIGLTFDEQTGLFAIFGALSVMVFVDFAGPDAVRAVAYGLLAVAGSLLIALGTLCSRSPAVAAAGMAVVGLVILFAGVTNGYLASATPAALLSFILPTMIPAPASAIPERLAGWWLACAVAIPAVLLVFPRRPRDRLRDAAVAAARAVADVAEAPTAERLAAADEAIDALHAQFAATPYRPSGPTTAVGAFAHVIDDLDWLHALCAALADADTTGVPETRAEELLRHASAAAIRASATELAGGDPDGPGPDELERLRRQIGEELLDAVDRLEERGAPDDEVWAALLRTWRARVVSYAALDLGEQARVAAGRGTGDPGTPRWATFLAAQRTTIGAWSRTAAAHAGVRSVWFRNSLRGALGLTIAVLLAQEATVQHGFWVVLGAMSVLRSSAVGTARTVVEAFTGTLVGIAVAAVLLIGLGGDRTLLWVVLPLACFGAAYAPRAISFGAGQAGFSIAVLIAFDLIAPTGWEVGLVRIEDVSIGFAISLGVGLLLWPRGARSLLLRSLGEAFATAGRYTALTAQRIFDGTGDGVVDAAGEAAAAHERLDVALRQRLSERGAHDPERMAAGMRLVAGAGRLRRTGAALDRLYALTPAVVRPEGLEPLAASGARLAAWYGALGDALAAHAAPPRADARDEELRRALVDALRDASGRGDRPAAQGAVAAAWAGMHVSLLRRMETRMAEAAEGAVARSAS